jgi:hypothetical protein
MAYTQDQEGSIRHLEQTGQAVLFVDLKVGFRLKVHYTMKHA